MTRVRVPAGKETPVYFNFAIVEASHEEVVISFCYGQNYADKPDNTLVRKLVCTPQALDRLINELQRLRGQPRPTG